MLCFFLSFLASGQAGACDARILTGRVLVLGSGKEEEDGRGPGFMLELGAVLLVLLLLLLLPLATNAWLLIKERKMHLSWLLTQLHLVHSVVSPSPQLCGGLCSAGCWLLVAGPASAVA